MGKVVIKILQRTAPCWVG